MAIWRNDSWHHRFGVRHCTGVRRIRCYSLHKSGTPTLRVAFYKARKDGATSLGIPIAGLGTNVVALFITIAWIIPITVVGFLPAGNS